MLVCSIPIVDWGCLQIIIIVIHYNQNLIGNIANLEILGKTKQAQICETYSFGFGFGFGFGFVLSTKVTPITSKTSYIHVN